MLSALSSLTLTSRARSEVGEIDEMTTTKKLNANVMRRTTTK